MSGTDDCPDFYREKAFRWTRKAFCLYERGSQSRASEVRHRMKNMYGNELYRGIRNGYPLKNGARILLIVDDAAYPSRGCRDSWNTRPPAGARGPTLRQADPAQIGPGNTCLSGNLACSGGCPPA